MSLFVCSNCNAVDNTAVTNFAVRRLNRLPPLCSECDPDISRWHGLFPKKEFTEFDRAEVINPPEPAYTLCGRCGARKYAGEMRICCM